MSKIQVFQVQIKLYLLKDIALNNLQEALCRFVDNAMSKEPIYLAMHQSKNYKSYTFGCLWPVERDRCYKKDGIYNFTIRTVDSGLAKFFSEKLVNEYDKNFKALTGDVKLIPKHLIEKLYSITTAIIKCEDGYWRDNHGVDEYKRLLRENLIKKYNFFTGEKLNENFEFVRSIEFQNKLPVNVPYKGISLQGDKFDLYVDENERSQDLAYLAMGVGVCENNSRGAGFVNCKWYS